MLYKSPEAIVTLFNDHFLIIAETKYKSIHGERHQILTPNIMLQRLPIPLVQVKGGNLFKNLLNEIRQIIYYLDRAKQITKKYNNIMNLIRA